MKWFKEFQESPFRPNVFTYNTLIMGYASHGDPKTALAYLQEMKLAALAPNAVSYSRVMDSFVKGDDLESATRLFEEMLDEGIEPNRVAFNSLIKGCSRQLDFHGAEYWLHRMQESMVPDSASFTWVLRGCKTEAQVKALVEEMMSLEVVPSASTLKAIDAVLGERGRNDLLKSYNFNFSYHKVWKPKDPGTGSPSSAARGR